MDVYLLYACDEWKSTASMSLVVVAADPDALYAMAAREVSVQNMGYGGETGKPALALMREDRQRDMPVWNRLDYGFASKEKIVATNDPSLRPFLPDADWR